MAEEFEYVMVESGYSPTLENNLLANIVLLTTGEAQYTNTQLQHFDSTERYLRVIANGQEEKGEG